MKEKRGRRNRNIPFPSHSLFLRSVLFKVYAPAEVTLFLSADISRNRLGASLYIIGLMSSEFPRIFKDFQGFSRIFKDFQGFSRILTF